MEKIKLNVNRVVVGTFRGFDQFMNLVIDNTVETNGNEKNEIGMVEGDAATTEEAKKSNHVARKVEKRQKGRQLDAHIKEQFGGGRLLACIASHPGQRGRCDGYILEGKELEFYMKKLQKKRRQGGY
ncbi:hypothetical protein GIB67_011655 [Kingdonia uniflora]|uniref:Sm domain-containing protein n=1 Tax=Kingdonia uniflora TaxID=39325 RepID=A0A7J7NAA9_9MAGN|nr:hypothetical protein GIB67_011655 [Kingdonia uniflora]